MKGKAVLMAFVVLSVALLQPVISVPSTEIENQTHDPATYVREDSEGVYIGNDLIEVGFRKDTGALWSILHKGSGVDLRGLKEDPGESLWDLSFSSEELQELGPSGIRRSRIYYEGYNIEQSDDRVTVVLKWRKVWLEEYGEYPAKVIASFTVFDNSPLARCSIQIINHGSAAIETVAFPIIYEVSKLGESPDDDIFVVPSISGVMFKNPSENLNWWGDAYPSGFLNMQFMAYYDPSAGFYIATYDNEGNTKFFFWYRWETSQLNLAVVHYPPVSFGSSFTLSYDVILGVFTGDWYTAADIYKQWAKDQWWSTEKDAPAWLREIAVGKDFYTYFSSGARKNRSFTEAMEKIEQHQEYFDLPSLIQLWGWENGGAWSSGNYFPPYEGWDKFDELIQRAHNSGAKIWVFISAHYVTVDSEPWRSGEAKPNAVLNKDGSYSIMIAPDLPEQRVRICPSTNFWKNKLKEWILTLVEHEVDLIQFDSLPWVSPASCYNGFHRHLIGRGGNWYSNAWIDILREIEEEARKKNPEVAFSGEGGSEIFLPFLDVYHSRDSWAEVEYRAMWYLGAWDPTNMTVIPLFRYVYGDQITFIGQHNLYLGWKPLGGGSYNLFGLSRLLTWGYIPDYNMQENLYDWNVDAEHINYVKKIGEARTTYVKDFISHGEMIRPPEISSPIVMVKSESGYTMFDVPSLQYSAWRSPKGDIGIIFTNIGKRTLTFDLGLDPSFYGLPIDENYTVYSMLDGKYQLISPRSRLPDGISLSVDPRQILLVVITTKTPATFKFSKLSISPAKTEIEEPITISVEVKNVGELQGENTVTLKINGKLVQSKPVALATEETKTIAFTVVENTEGIYDVNVEGLTGSFRVTEALPVSEPFPWALMIGAIIVVITVITTLIVIYRREH